MRHFIKRFGRIISLAIVALGLGTCASGPSVKDLQTQITSLQESKTGLEAEKTQLEASLKSAETAKSQSEADKAAQQKKIDELQAQIDHLSKLLAELQATGKRPEDWKPGTGPNAASQAKVPASTAMTIPPTIQTVASLTQVAFKGRQSAVAGTRLVRDSFATGFALFHQVVMPGTVVAYPEIVSDNSGRRLYVVFEVTHQSKAAVLAGRILQARSVSGNPEASVTPDLSEAYTDGQTILERWFYRIEGASETDLRRLLASAGWKLSINHPNAAVFDLTTPLSAAYGEVYQAWQDLNR